MLWRLMSFQYVARVKREEHSRYREWHNPSHESQKKYILAVVQVAVVESSFEGVVRDKIGTPIGFTP